MKKEIDELKKELKSLRIKYQELLERYTKQNNEIIMLKEYISMEVKNENKHRVSKARASRH